MSIPLITIIAAAAVMAGVIAFRLSANSRPNRRIAARASWSELADDDPAVPTADFDEIDAYWGAQMPPEVASWSAEGGLERVEDDAASPVAELAEDDADAPVEGLVAAAPDPDEEAQQDDLDAKLDAVLAAHAKEPAPAAEARQRKKRTRRPRDADRVSLAEQQLGKKGCRLGAAWLTNLLENGFMPTGSRGECTTDQIRAALKALQTGQPTRILDHGAIIQRLGNQHFVLVEPLARPVHNARNMLVAAGGVIGTDTLHVVVATHEDADAEHSAHVADTLQHFTVPPERVVLLQEDGTFHSHFEDQAHFVPGHLDPWAVPESFVAEMMGYAQARFDENEPEAALRTLGPLAGTLWDRSTNPHAPTRFDAVLLAQVLNLLGVANRAVSASQEAATCFESALILLRDLEAYSSVQVVETNLGSTLCELAQHEPDLYRLATRHLQNAVRLDQNDAYAWQLLSEAFLSRYEVERSTSLLGRAEHALEQAARGGRSPAIEAVSARIEDLRALRRSMDCLPGVARPSTGALPTAQLALPLDEGADLAEVGSASYALRRESSG